MQDKTDAGAIVAACAKYGAAALWPLGVHRADHSEIHNAVAEVAGLDRTRFDHDTELDSYHRDQHIIEEGAVRGLFPDAPPAPDEDSPTWHSDHHTWLCTVLADRLILEVELSSADETLDRLTKYGWQWSLKRVGTGVRFYADRNAEDEEPEVLFGVGASVNAAFVAAGLAG